MKKQSYTLEVPERLMNQLTEIANASGQNLNDVIIQTLKGGMPPSLRQVPNRFHGDLLSLNALGDLELWDVISKPQKEEVRVQERKNEEKESKDFEFFGSLKKAYAISLLRWRGHPVPAPSELLVA